MNDYTVLLTAFKAIGVKAEENNGRDGAWSTESLPKEATKYISTGIAHYHFDINNKYLGVECNGDGTFVAV